MRTLIAILSISFMSLTAAQAQETETPGFAKHSFGLNFFNGISSVRIKNSEVDELLETKVQYATWAEMFYQYRPVKWFSVEVGAGYSSIKFLSDDPRLPYYDFGFSIGGPSPEDMKLVYSERLQQWTVPLNLRWYYQHNQWSVYALTGVLYTNDWRKTISNTLNDFERTRYLDDEMTLNWRSSMAVSAGLGAECQVGKRVMLRFEECFRIFDLVHPEVVKGVHYDYVGFFRPFLNNWAVGTNLGVYVTL